MRWNTAHNPYFPLPLLSVFLPGYFVPFSSPLTLVYFYYLVLIFSVFFPRLFLHPEHSIIGMYFISSPGSSSIVPLIKLMCNTKGGGLLL
ncbi:hypothetical protein B9Z19DRAFT_363294 [Tuber borchii]|uniref:Uncharacterized protein n=1 Tax=Tuber borchii TaxID=42251 RepID=A0A2T6ZIG1_TUBBO|nr:hypothetical protein B9Z19DRAFT_363294 [Tuber borchii]